MPSRITNLQAAEDDLAELTVELPRFEALVRENEAEAQRLKEARADPAEQAAARGRVNVSRELLEQHRADIAATEQRVEEMKARRTQADDLKRLKKLEAEVLAARASWIERAVGVCNALFETAAALRWERLGMQDRLNEADALRRRLKEQGVEGVPDKPKGLLDYPPKIWSLRTFVDPSKTTSLVVQFDNILNGSGIYTPLVAKESVMKTATDLERLP